MNQYIERILRENLLSDEAKLLGQTAKTSWYVDRHVALPQANEYGDLIRETCAAGLHLLARWKQEREQLMTSMTLLISEPLLIIDDAWLQQCPEAPVPHIWITLAKNKESYHPLEFDRGLDDFDRCPLRTLIEAEIGRARVARIDPNPSPPVERPGGWLVF